MYRVLLFLSIILVAKCACPEDYDQIQGSCFFFANDDVSVNLTWFDARAYCGEKGGVLAKVDDCSLFATLVRFIHLNGLEASPGYWLGGADLGDEGAWYWNDGTAMELGVPFWGSDDTGAHQPSGGTNENCALMKQNNQYYFHDEDCELLAYPLCRAEP